MEQRQKNILLEGNGIYRDNNNLTINNNTNWFNEESKINAWDNLNEQTNNQGQVKTQKRTNIKVQRKKYCEKKNKIN